MKMPRRPKEVTEKIDKIVNYYMNFVVGHEYEFKEFLDYYWRCMSSGTLDDYGDLVDKAYNIDLADEIEKMREEINQLRIDLSKARGDDEY